jgi:hypothetical protein
MGAGLAHLGHECVAFVARLSADDFFSKLAIKQTPNGPEYFDGARKVTKFPSELTINIYMIAWSCPNADANSEHQQVSFQDLRWSIAWKTGLKTRQPQELDAKPIQTSRAEFEKQFSLERFQMPNLWGSNQSSTPAEYWSLTLAVHDQEAHITDSLILKASTAAERQIQRFSAHL